MLRLDFFTQNGGLEVQYNIPSPSPPSDPGASTSASANTSAGSSASASDGPSSAGTSACVCKLAEVNSRLILHYITVVIECNRHADHISPSINKEFTLVWEWSELESFDVVTYPAQFFLGGGACTLILSAQNQRSSS